MQKNFKQEYKEYMQSSTPDLWDRIEMELPMKEAEKNDKKIFFRKHTLLIAACFCAVLLIPVTFAIQRGVLSKSVTESEEARADVNMADMATPMMAETVPLESEIIGVVKEKNDDNIYYIEIVELIEESPVEWEIGSMIEASGKEIEEIPKTEKEYKIKIQTDTQPYTIIQIKEK